MTSPERLNALIQAVQYVIEQNIPGDIVECGVWKGGSMMAAALTLIRLNSTERTLHLFDTYEGMPPATAEDIDHKGVPAEKLMSEQDRDTSVIWAYAQLDEVKTNLKRTAYPADRVKFIQGRVEETIPAAAPPTISILRLDTDWYESTKHEFEHLFPRLSPGGVLIIDDYGHWEGARKATDEYVRNHNVRILLCRIDYCGRIAVKQV
ncbi:MAG TPA: TylF/MycF/NovP-related O-methyltransferase [Lacipirellulaceae bacterium]